MKIKIALVITLQLIHLGSIGYAGSVWQKQSNEPCAGQVIVGDSGDGNDSYIIPAPSDDYNRGGYEYEYDEEDADAFEEGPVPDHMDDE